LRRHRARGSPALGKDAGELAGLGPIGVAVTDDPLPAFVQADGVLDFTAPAATVNLPATPRRRASCMSSARPAARPEDDEKIKAAARHATIVKSGNMSLGVNLLGVLVKQAARALGPDWDIEVLEMHHKHKVDAPSGTALLLGEARRQGRGIALAEHSVRVRDGHTGPRPAGLDRLCHAARRLGHRRAFGDACRRGRAHRDCRTCATDRGDLRRGAVKAALWARDRKPGLYSMLDVLGRLHEPRLPRWRNW
jgi:4-hydroxy-tetrahydrodipicolinate reductase